MTVYELENENVLNYTTKFKEFFSTIPDFLSFLNPEKINIKIHSSL